MSSLTALEPRLAWPDAKAMVCRICCTHKNLQHEAEKKQQKQLFAAEQPRSVLNTPQDY